MDQSASRTCLVGVDFCWDVKVMLVASLVIGSSVLNVYIWKWMIRTDLVTSSGVTTFDEDIRFVVTGVTADAGCRVLGDHRGRRCT